MRTRLHTQARKARRQAGFTLIEIMLAGVILIVASAGVLAMISVAIGTNSRNKHDSTKTMLGQAVIEQVTSTLVGTGSASLTDCAGNNHTIASAAGGSARTGGLGSDIDFTQATPPTDYHMDYVITSPCATGGSYVATYDVRWRVDQIGASAGTPTSSFLLTVGARMKGSGTQSGVLFSLPVNMRTVIGRPE